MVKRSLKSILAQQSFLKGLKDPYLELLTGCAANVRFESGKLLFKQGEAADRFYLIRQGRVRIELPVSHHEPVTIQTVDKNEVLGWSWMVPPYRWHFSARADGTVLALSFDGKCIRSKFEKDHELGYEMCHRFSIIIAQRLEDTILQVAGICGC